MNAATVDAAAEGIEDPISSRLMTRIFFGFAVLAMLSLALSLVGKWFGSSIALAGYTDDPSSRQVVIGNHVIVAPANTIRFERARRDGIASRLDLYLRWPQLDGYAKQARDDFNNVGNRRNILFLGLEERMMSRDMSGRFAPIYRSLIVAPGRKGPGGLTIYEFSKKSGYLNEVLAVASRGANEPFVARCLTGPSAEDSLAPCERDVDFGDNLSLTYRFPAELLADWKTLDAAVMARARGMLKASR
ncbi:hypothetical protein RB623_24155 [Mesorhizobium sp. LHD-90]|uniref:hypothetical protein n=1 Tax=Mesorhizobium sp. LHD-90 TaxID=3071414 RepID=UPI0027DF0E5B|nr:hypothetical protein [Mesorhizobium sp. LHD-90]MDQ6437158.1 hypothetical protein [Mesorhizobium sp. LHD-90]